jgi:hypothetical protein
LRTQKNSPTVSSDDGAGELGDQPADQRVDVVADRRISLAVFPAGR